MRYSFIVAAAAMGCGIGTADAQTTTQPAIEYTLGIQVVSNGVTDAGGDLAALAVGTLGTLNLLVNDDASVFPPTDAWTTFYEILDLSIDIGTVQSGALSGAYPSSTMFEGLGITDNGPSGGGLFDFFGGVMKFENPELGFSILSLTEDLGAGEPTLLSSQALPLAMDLSLTTGVDFTIQSNLSPSSARVVFEVVTFSATPVPAPSSAAVLGVAALGMRRRR